MKKIFESRPYMLTAGYWPRFRQALVFALFVALFLYLLQPFGIGTLGARLLNLSLGFGAVTFAVMVTLNVVLPAILRKWYAEENWTLHREIFQTGMNIVLIGFFNFLYYAVAVTGTFSWVSFVWFQFSTLLVGFFPVTMFIILNERKGRSKYQREAEMISNSMRVPPDAGPEPAQIIIHDHNRKDGLSVSSDSLLYISAADNYVDLHYLDEAKPSRKTMRNSVQDVQQQLGGEVCFFRCHRSYIVNLKKVSRLSGNAQGYRLHFKETDETVPVSRLHNDVIKDLILSSG